MGSSLTTYWRNSCFFSDSGDLYFTDLSSFTIFPCRLSSPVGFQRGFATTSSAKKGKCKALPCLASIARQPCCFWASEKKASITEGEGTRLIELVSSIGFGLSLSVDFSSLLLSGLLCAGLHDFRSTIFFFLSFSFGCIEVIFKTQNTHYTIRTKYYLSNKRVKSVRID
jgi:hypothetical protein